MPRYTYKARDGKGRAQQGFIESASDADAMRKLRSDGLVVTDLRLASEMVDVERVRTAQAARNVKREEVISFSAQLSVMLDTGVPLAEALGAFLQQARPGGMRRIVEVVADRINSGVSFSVSLGEFPRVFPQLMISLLKASEAAGSLGAMLSRVADYLGKDRRTVRQIKGALTYPAVMVGMAVAVTSFLVAWVLPRFAKIYESRSATLPTPTRLLMSFSNFIGGNWIALLIGAIVLGVAGWLFRRSRAGRRAIDLAKVRMPIIGPIFVNFYLSRATRTLGTLLSAGVTLPDALRIVRGVTNNVHWTDLWNRMEEAMTSGRTIADALSNTPLIPPSVTQMITAGERTGRLPQVLDRIASVAETDLDESVKTGTQMIEPLVIMFMGLVIGGIAIALLLPIFTISKVAQ